MVRLFEAIAFAVRRHDGHFRKDGVTPYVVHPLRVMATLALKLGIDDETTLCAAVLHDTVEDTRTDYDDIESLFGKEVAELVAAMTKDKRLPQEVREEAFERQVAEAPLKARLVKLVDNYDNLGDMGHMTPEARREAARRKEPHVESICATLPDDYRAFADEVKARLAAALE